jgi:predicted NAD/FAD-dependent oxidoreductase
MSRLSPDQSVAVIGAGVAGCAVAAQLRRRGWPGPIQLWEMGRGPGGRAATRRSRQDPELRIDHGAPLLGIDPTLPPPELLPPLMAGRWLQPFTGTLASLGTGGLRLGPGDDPLNRGQLYGAPAGMDQLCRGLLTLAAEAATPLIGAAAVPIGHFQCLVRHLEWRPPGGWRLLDGQHQLLGEADWLLLSGSLLAHPRSRSLLGWPAPPLQEAATGLRDPQLDRALAAIGAIEHEAGSNLLMVVPAATATPWRDLPFRLLSVEPELQARWPLRRLVIQPLADGRCAVVAHGSAAFSREHRQVFGAGSAAARLGAATDPEAEATVIAALGEALRRLVSPWIADDDPGLAEASRQLMRWGAAFPLAPGLPEEASFCPASRIGFCGDMVAGPGFGRIEGALRSAERLATALLAPAENPAR